jgi:hypothetical protein
MTTEYAQIPLKTKSGTIYALIDKEDEEKVLAEGPWHLGDKCVKNSKAIKLHCFLTSHFGRADGKVVDHLDRNILHNWKKNLEVKTQAANIQNKSKQDGTTSKYFGVSWSKSTKKWIATTQYKQTKTIRIGSYDNELEAAYAYNCKMLELDSKARINEGVPTFPDIKFAKTAKEKSKNYKIRNGKYSVYMSVNNKMRHKTVDTEEKAEELVKVWKVEQYQAKLDQNRLILKPRVECDITYISVSVCRSKECKEVMIDTDQLEAILPFTWIIGKSGYAKCSTNNNGAMHLFLYRLKFGRLEEGDTRLVDHKDMNKLNNTTPNFRLASPSLNSHNKPKKVGASSQYFGVYFNKDKTWTAQIKKDGLKIHIGQFKTEQEAAEEYDKKAEELWEDDARLNFSPKRRRLA